MNVIKFRFVLKIILFFLLISLSFVIRDYNKLSLDDKQNMCNDKCINKDFDRGNYTGGISCLCITENNGLYDNGYYFENNFSNIVDFGGDLNNGSGE